MFAQVTTGLKVDLPIRGEHFNLLMAKVQYIGRKHVGLYKLPQ